MSASSLPEADDEADEGTKTAAASPVSIIGEWFEAPEAKVFREVRLRCKRESEAARKEGAYVPQYGPIHRSYCVVRISSLQEDQENAARAQLLEFRLGETHGYALPAEPAMAEAPWSPPPESARTDVAPWLTEAVLCLASAGCTAADFQAAGDPHDTAKSSGGLVGCCRVELLTASPTYDVLADNGVVLRMLEEGPKDSQMPRDLARVSASWRVWFQRNGELVVNTSGSERLDPDKGVEFVLDEAKLMVGLEMALKDMRCGSRGVLRVSEDWGQGSLMPGGSIVLRGAAIWVELALHRVENELQPGEHASVDEALAFALTKKEQGNASLILDTKADVGRAVRRYEAGISTLEAVLPAAARAPSSSASSAPSQASQKGPLAEEVQRPRVEELLNALRLNAAQAELKRSRWKAAVGFCDAVLRRDPGNLKGLYRRGMARAELEEFDDAVGDFKRAAAAAPADAAFRRELARVEAARRKHRASEKRSFGGMFEKMKQEDENMQQQEPAEDASKPEQSKQTQKSEPPPVAAAPAAAEAPAATAAAEPPPTEEAPATAAAPAAAAGQATAAAPAAPDAPAATAATTPTTEAKAAEEDESVDVLKDLGIPHTNGPEPSYLMPPQGMQRMTTEEPPPINYEVPSFLRKGKKKKA